MNYREALEQMNVGPGKGVMVNLNETGDTKIIWDLGIDAEVAHARAAYDKAMKDGYMAYKVTGEKGEKGEVMHGFNPKAERIILAPPLQGG